jgi:ABC-type transport system substrate-binding protein
MENLVLKKKRHLFLLFAVIITAGWGLSVLSRSNDKINENEMVMYSAIGGKVASLDPGNIGDTSSSAVASQIFECLYDYHYLKRPYEIIPHIASKMPEISEDGLTYTIEIKKGVYFTDDECFGGRERELNASDFVYSWKRLADIKYLSKNWWVFDGKIAGLDEFREYTKTCKTADEVDYSRPIEGLQAVDDYTLKIRLNRPWPQLLYLLAHLPTAPVAKEAVDYYGKGIINHPVGTGPFFLKVWNRGSYIELVRNKGYRDEYYPVDGEESDVKDGYLVDAGKKIPFADRIFFMQIDEDPPSWFLFLNGKLDVSIIPKDNFQQAIQEGFKLSPELSQKGIHLKVYRDPSTYWIGFNMEDAVIGKNKPLRQAIAYCIDKKKYIDLFTNNRAEIADGFIPPLMDSYDKSISSMAYNYDINKGRELVKEAERLNGGTIPVLKLGMPGTDVVSRQQGQFYQKAFKEIGLELEIDYMDWPMYLERMHKKDLQIFQSGWVADYPDAENFLQLFYSKNVSPGPNNFNYVNSRFDTVYETASVMLGSDERTELYRKAQRIVMEDCPAVFLLHGVAYTLHHDWVKNYKPNTFQYGLSKFRRIDVEQRKAYKCQ